MHLRRRRAQMSWSDFPVAEETAYSLCGRECVHESEAVDVGLFIKGSATATAREHETAPHPGLSLGPTAVHQPVSEAWLGLQVRLGPVHGVDDVLLHVSAHVCTHESQNAPHRNLSLIHI